MSTFHSQEQIYFKMVAAILLDLPFTSKKEHIILSRYDKANC